ncbi:MAG: hypothetical protein EXS63_06200 [Candidatus Omnitrophica bacterium]|nr:hypothetical protein [Candidatus Omnitrophota bacterium]
MIKKHSSFLALLVVILAASHLGMARKGQYDEEAREAERQEKNSGSNYQAPSPAEAAKNFVGGMKQATVGSATGLVSDTIETTRKKTITSGNATLHEGDSAVLDNTVKGVAKVATLGYGQVNHYEVEDPKAGTNETSKIKIKW